MDGSLTADDVESILEQKIPLTYRAVNYLLHRKITDRKDICILCPGKLRGNVEVSESVVNSDLQSTRIFLCPILDSENTCILLIYDFTASPARIVTFDSLNEDLTSLRDDITEYGCRLALLLGSDRSSFENAEFITGTCAPDANENASHTWTVHNGIEATKDIGRVSDNVLLGRQNINRIRNALRSSLENDATYAALVQSVKDKKKVKQQTEKKQEPSKKQLQRYDIPKLFEEISHLLPKSDFLKHVGCTTAERMEPLTMLQYLNILVHEWDVFHDALGGVTDSSSDRLANVNEETKRLVHRYHSSMHRQQVLYSFYAGPYVCIISRRGTKLKKFPKAIYNYATLNYPNLTESNDVLDIFGVEFDLSTVHFTYKPHSSLYGNMPVTDIFEKDKLLFGCETFTMVDAVEKQFPKECQYLDNNIQLKDLMNDFKVRLTNFHIYVSTVRTTTRDLSPPEIIYKEVVETFRPHGKKKPGNWKTYNSWIDIRSKVFSDLVVRDSSRTELHYSMAVYCLPINMWIHPKRIGNCECKKCGSEWLKDTASFCCREVLLMDPFSNRLSSIRRTYQNALDKNTCILDYLEDKWKLRSHLSSMLSSSRNRATDLPANKCYKYINKLFERSGLMRTTGCKHLPTCVITMVERLIADFRGAAVTTSEPSVFVLYKPLNVSSTTYDSNHFWMNSNLHAMDYVEFNGRRRPIGDELLLQSSTTLPIALSTAIFGTIKNDFLTEFEDRFPSNPPIAAHQVLREFSALVKIRIYVHRPTEPEYLMYGWYEYATGTLEQRRTLPTILLKEDDNGKFNVINPLRFT